MKNKVLIIVENESVPFDSRVWKESLALRDHGYQVSVLCPKRWGSIKAYELLDGIHIYRHPTVGEGSGPAGYLVEFAWALMCEFLFAWWIFFRRGFHVIQGCNPPDDIFLVALPFKLLGVKYIFDHHDANPELYLVKYGRKDFLYRCQVALERLTYRFSDVVMATNGSYRELALTRGRRRPEDVFIVRNGPDLNTFRAVPPSSALKHGKRYLVGYVGTMNMQDGLDVLLEVALRIKAAGRKDVHFTCVGGGPALPDLREMVAQKDLSGMVEFTGRVPDAKLLEILSTADICVNPDRPCEINNISTMIKIMEYMALGKPIVQFESKEGRFSAQAASLYAGGEDLVGDFAAKLLDLLDRPDEREKMGRFGRKRVTEELAWEYSIRHLRAAYERAFSKQRHPFAVLIQACAKSYYSVKPLVPRRLQVALRRQVAERALRAERDRWPICENAGSPPPGWPGWPGGKRFALVLSHDVESALGVPQCLRVADLEQERGFNSSFGFVPLRYHTPESLRRALVDRGFEVMVHDLYHDGKLYRSRRLFDGRRARINDFLHEWQARGFASGSMHHDLTWIADLDIDYDLSTCDVDPFEPQACGFGRIFPCFVQPPDGHRPGFVELPYTLPQDFTSFVLLRESTNAIWRRKLDWIAEKGGMVLIKTHPDYMAFNGRSAAYSYPVELYSDFLDYIRSRYAGQYWLANPSELARFWRGVGPLGCKHPESVAAHTTLCPNCRRAHAAGWLSEYPPRSQAGVPAHALEE